MKKNIQNSFKLDDGAAIMGKKHQNSSYTKTIARIQSEMDTVSRLFSKVIHNNIIEKISTIIGVTIARPNSILFGSVLAFIFSLLTYFIAKQIGYRLSGSETIISFCVGWVIGVIYDYIKLLFKRKN